MRRTTLLCAAAVLPTLLTAGCAVLPDMDAALVPPRVRLSRVKLVEAPSRQQLQAALCPHALRSDGTQLASQNVEESCQASYGPVPPSASLDVIADLDLEIENPNSVPLPFAEVLSAIAVFPERAGHRQGASCLVLCPPNDLACRSRSDAPSCDQAAEAVTTVADYGAALPDLFVVQGWRRDDSQRVGRERAELPPRRKVPVTVRIAFVPEALVPITAEAVRRSAHALRQGKSLPLEIPYQLEGTVFVEGGTSGRLAGRFGPVNGSWPLPNEPLLLAQPLRTLPPVAAARRAD